MLLVLASAAQAEATDAGHGEKASSTLHAAKPAAKEHRGGSKLGSVLAAVKDRGENQGGHAKAAKGRHGWGYSGNNGPDAWSDLSQDFAACAAGTMQSPIDISQGGTLSAAAPEIVFHYELTPLRILNNGHTIQVNFDPGSHIVLDGRRFDLAQFHFHTPSEHSVEGKRFPMEAHLVHVGAGGELAVLGILFNEGADNLALRETWAMMPEHEGPEESAPEITLNARELLPDETAYFRYMGSLTMPPCSEGVNWHVFTQPVEASHSQIARFVDVIGANARPIQAQNSRLVLEPVATN